MTRAGAGFLAAFGSGDRARLAELYHQDAALWTPLMGRFGAHPPAYSRCSWETANSRLSYTGAGCDGAARRLAGAGRGGVTVVLWASAFVAIRSGWRYFGAGALALGRLLGGWLLREGFPRRLVAGLAVSFVGAVVVGLAESAGGRAPLLGVAACLLAAVSYAIAVVAQKSALRHASAALSGRRPRCRSRAGWSRRWPRPRCRPRWTWCTLASSRPRWRSPPGRTR